ncbi:MAG: hypothetical protein ACOCSE_05975 [Chitinivibrionales bacterium]
MSFFEAGMLFCFGAAWPVSIYKSFRYRRNGSKSLAFMVIILSGYTSGIVHKILYSMDPVFALYVLNWVMVFTDIMLFMRNRAIEKSLDSAGV